MRDLVKTLDAASGCGFRVTITTLLVGFDFCISEIANLEAQRSFHHTERAGELGDAIHAQILEDYPHSIYAARQASTTDPSAISTPSVYPTQEEQEGASIQIMAGAIGMRKGHVTLLMINAPICPLKFNGEDILVPAIQMQARQAMEIGMNIIWVSKSEEGANRE